MCQSCDSNVRELTLNEKDQRLTEALVFFLSIENSLFASNLRWLPFCQTGSNTLYQKAKAPQSSITAGLLSFSTLLCRFLQNHHERLNLVYTSKIQHGATFGIGCAGLNRFGYRGSFSMIKPSKEPIRRRLRQPPKQSTQQRHT